MSAYKIPRKKRLELAGRVIENFSDHATITVYVTPEQAKKLESADQVACAISWYPRGRK